VDHAVVPCNYLQEPVGAVAEDYGVNEAELEQAEVARDDFDVSGVEPVQE
jgi:hypothetical protein